MKNQVFLFCLCVAFSCCSIVNNSAKKDFADGFYNQRKEGKKLIVYVDVENEIICIHQVKKNKKINIVDTTMAFQSFSKEMNADFKTKPLFSKQSFDIDFLTIPLKYRLAQGEVPSQINTNLNGALFLGFRNDKYLVNYNINPLGKSSRNINHFGFSFSGLGNTFMSPTNTNNLLKQEYDGIIWNKGVAGILAVNNFTVGLSLGFDYLLDNNYQIWIYQNKPWLGLTFGLNLN
jgi:hypothetical protein